LFYGLNTDCFLGDIAELRGGKAFLADPTA